MTTPRYHASTFGFGTRLLTCIAGLTLCASSSFAQVSVTATAGTLGPTPYTTVKAAFDAINAGTHQGDVTIDVSANTTEGTTPATLNSSGAGSASYTSVLLFPSVDGVSISGNPVTGFGVIQLNGADNVTINGDNPNSAGTNRDLTINNTTTATVIANSAVRIAVSAAVTSADNNTIKNCNLNGNVTGGNSSLITSTTGSSNSSFGIYCGGNGGATATGAPTAITSVTSNSAPSGTTINNLVIDNNAVNQCARAIVFIGAATTVSNGVTITNNVVGASGTPSPATPPYTSPATTVYTKGIYVAGTSAVTVTGNTIQNQMSYVATQNSCIELNTAIGTSVNISNNTVTNHTQNASSSAAKSIAVSSASGTYTVSNNTVTSTQAVSGSSGTDAIECGGTATSGTIELNKITTVYNRSTGTFGCYGINVTAGTNITVKNNVVSDLRMDMTGGAAFSTTFGVHGIRIGGGTAHKVYHNSVNLYGSMFGTATTSILSSACTVVGTGQTGLDIRNNIFSNTMTGGTTSVAHVALYLPSAGTSAMNLTLNSNAYYSGTDSARQGIGQVGTTAGTGFYLASNFVPGSTSPASNLRAYSSTLSAAGTNDNNSMAATSAAPFTSATDLHIPAATVTELESKGSAVGVTTDIDGDARPGPTGSVNGGATAPDLGADEFDGTPGESTPPAITYTALGPTNSLSARTLSVNITDASGVPTAGAGLPVLYWKVNAGSYTAATGTFISGSQYDFSFGSGVSLGDVVSYYVVAQDGAVTPNLGCNPSAGAAGLTANPPAAATPPTTPNVYYVAEITGNKTVGAGGDYADLATAITALNNAVITRPVVFSLTDASYTVPSGGLVINANPGSSATNTVTITLASGNVATISGSVASGAVIKLNGASYVTIDGSNSGGSDRSLTISNTSTTSPIVVWFGSVGTTPIVGDVLKNCIAINGVNTNSAIVVADATTASAGYFSNITIHNNNVQKAFIGVYANGGTVPQNGSNLAYTNNEFNTAGANSVRYTGLYMQGVNGATVTGNKLSNFSGTESEDDRGIWLASGTINATVDSNRISSLKYTGTSGYGTHGIAVSTAVTGANVRVSNNMIWDLSGDGWNYTSILGDNTFGIYAFGTQSGVGIHFNSINLTGNTLNQTSAMSAGIALATGTTADVSNNSVVNNLGLLGATGYGTVGIFLQTSAAQLSSASNNDYFVNPTGSGVKAVGQIATTASLTLGAWQTATSLETGSLNVDPLYVSATDLHLQSSSPLLGAGVTVAGITTDIDGDSRGTPPEIGADELPPVVPPCVGDVNLDGSVGVADLLAVIAAWGPCATCPSTPCATDIDHDCNIGVADLLSVISHWGTCP